MAARCGAVLSDMEFVQFHPTAFDIGIDPAPLATEALRGEGAKIINSKFENKQNLIRIKTVIEYLIIIAIIYYIFA